MPICNSYVTGRGLRGISRATPPRSVVGPLEYVSDDTTLVAPLSTFTGFIPEGDLREHYKLISTITDTRVAPCITAITARQRSRHLPMRGGRAAIAALLSAIVEAKHGGVFASELIDDWEHNKIRNHGANKLDSMIEVREATTP